MAASDTGRDCAHAVLRRRATESALAHPNALQTLANLGARSSHPHQPPGAQDQPASRPGDPNQHGRRLQRVGAPLQRHGSSQIAQQRGYAEESGAAKVAAASRVTISASRHFLAPIWPRTSSLSAPARQHSGFDCHGAVCRRRLYRLPPLADRYAHWHFSASMLTQLPLSRHLAPPSSSLQRRCRWQPAGAAARSPARRCPGCSVRRGALRGRRLPLRKAPTATAAVTPMASPRPRTSARWVLRQGFAADLANAPVHAPQAPPALAPALAPPLPPQLDSPA